LIVPAWVGGATMLVALILGARGLTDLLAFGLAAFALAAIARQYVVGARARRAAYGESWPRAVGWMIRANPRLYGGLVVHTGIVLIAVALAASSTYSTKQEVRLAKGQSATVAGYQVTYLGSQVTTSAQKRVVKARVRIQHDGDDLGVYAPSVNIFPNSTSAIGTPSVRTGLVRDVYLTLVSSPASGGGKVTLGVAVNPMVVWLWIGGGFLVIGTAVALTPVSRRRLDSADESGEPEEPDAEPREPEPVPV